MDARCTLVLEREQNAMQPPSMIFCFSSNFACGSTAASASRSPHTVIAGALVGAQMFGRHLVVFMLAFATPSAPPSASAAAAAFARARLALLRTARRRIAARQAAAAAAAVTTTVKYDRCEGDGGGRPVAADLEMVAKVAASEGRLQPHSGEKERR